MYGTSVCKFDSRNFPLFYNSYIKPLSLISMTWLTYSQVIKHIQDSERKQIKQFCFVVFFFFKFKSYVPKRLRAHRKVKIWWRIAPWPCSRMLSSPSSTPWSHTSLSLLLRLPLGTSLLSRRTPFFLVPPLSLPFLRVLSVWVLFIPHNQVLTLSLPLGALAQPFTC